VNSEIIQAMDASGDGQIQRDEWWWGDDFTGFGSDQNGILNKGELAKIPTASARLTPTELRSRTRWMQRIILYISIFFGIIHAL